MGGHGPPHAVLFQSFLPTRAAVGGEPSGIELAVAARSTSTQWTQVRFGFAGSGASGSSTISAKLLVPAGGADQRSSGEMSCPSQVKRAGISFSWAKAGELSENPCPLGSVAMASPRA